MTHAPCLSIIVRIHLLQGGQSSPVMASRQYFGLIICLVAAVLPGWTSCSMYDVATGDAPPSRGNPESQGTTLSDRKADYSHRDFLADAGVSGALDLTMSEASIKPTSASYPLDAHVSAAAPSDDVRGMPEFPSKPPKPCAKASVPTRLFRRGNEAKLGDLDLQITGALDLAGYSARRYYRFKDGFAIATQVEEFRDDGTSQPGPHRFVANLQDFGTTRFDLSRILDRFVTFFTGEIGQYRLFVLTVSSQQPEPTEKKLDIAEARELWEAGWTSLPNSMAKWRWDENIRVELLIYEFETREGLAPGVRQPSLTAETHLKRSEILKGLNR